VKTRNDILHIITKQHYPPGTQKNYNIFSLRNLITGKGKELEFPEGWGGGKGEPPVPPITKNPPFGMQVDVNEVQTYVS